MSPSATAARSVTPLTLPSGLGAVPARSCATVLLATSQRLCCPVKPIERRDAASQSMTLFSVMVWAGSDAPAQVAHQPRRPGWIAVRAAAHHPSRAPDRAHRHHPRCRSHFAPARRRYQRGTGRKHLPISPAGRGAMEVPVDVSFSGHHHAMRRTLTGCACRRPKRAEPTEGQSAPRSRRPSSVAPRAARQ